MKYLKKRDDLERERERERQRKKDLYTLERKGQRHGETEMSEYRGLLTFRFLNVRILL